MGVLRWRGQLDYLIERTASRSVERLEPVVRVALRIGTYQLRFTRVPEPAAVHESVELVKRAHRRFAAGLVNAALRRIPKNPINDLLGGINESARKAALLSHPAWLLARWEKRWGAAVTEQIAAYNNTVPPTTIRVNEDRISRQSALEQLTAAGLTCTDGALLSSSIRVTAGDVTKTELFASGSIWVQDEASQLVPLLVAPRDGEYMLDCCAAPGGKSAALRALAPNARLLSMDLHPHRARLLKRLLREPGTWVIAADAASGIPIARQFDRVLVDAPCSGTGTLARNPEIRWRLREEDLGSLARRQQQILENALTALIPGGHLVYSVCSLEPEEGVEVVREVLNDSYELVPIRDVLESEPLRVPPLRLTDGYFLQTIPGRDPCDGFFAAVIRRK
jgi:16S rRNA (cytosine967-C5)-methyltransferase